MNFDAIWNKPDTNGHAFVYVDASTCMQYLK